MKKVNALFISIILSVFFSSCFEDSGKGSLIIAALLTKPSLPPISLENLIAVPTLNSINLSKPVCIYGGGTIPVVTAYIGIDGEIIETNGVVLGNNIVSKDVSLSGCTFNNLIPDTVYHIIAVARNSRGYAVKDAQLNTGQCAPVLNEPIISVNNTCSMITLSQPSFSVLGYPVPPVYAYFGYADTIKINESVVTDYISGPVNVSSSGCSFSIPEYNKTYRIIVVTSNIKGYSVVSKDQQINSVPPVLNELQLSLDETCYTINLSKPDFTEYGCPSASWIRAYIGYADTITISGSVIDHYITGDIDVRSSGCSFSIQELDKTYRIVVVAKNILDQYSVISKDLSITATAPILQELDLSVITDCSVIQLSKPDLSAPVCPTPSVYAYIGYADTITILGSNVANYISGPINVRSSGYNFNITEFGKTYRVVVVASNVYGESVQYKDQLVGEAPVMNGLSISGFNASSITVSLYQPPFSTEGCPLPTVNAYIGIEGEITDSGDGNITGSRIGPVPVNVSSGVVPFTGLDPGTSYKIYIVARNGAGYSVKDITQQTASE